jgi:hypothetical protein
VVEASADRLRIVVQMMVLSINADRHHMRRLILRIRLSVVTHRLGAMTGSTSMTTMVPSCTLKMTSMVINQQRGRHVMVRAIRASGMKRDNMSMMTLVLVEARKITAVALETGAEIFREGEKDPRGDGVGAMDKHMVGKVMVAAVNPTVENTAARGAREDARMPTEISGLRGTAKDLKGTLAERQDQITMAGDQKGMVKGHQGPRDLAGDLNGRGGNLTGMVVGQMGTVVEEMKGAQVHSKTGVDAVVEGSHDG